METKGTHAYDNDKDPIKENENSSFDIYYCIFFDGTKDHRGQAQVGESKREGDPENNIKPHPDYKGPLLNFLSPQATDPSNIALLEGFCSRNKREKKENQRFFSVYIEGIGTYEQKKKEKSTEIESLKYGTGKEGITAKVKKAIDRIPGFINSLRISKKSNLNIYFELFGFSRGAAAARHCTWSILEDRKEELKKKLNEKKQFKAVSTKVDFVGLFDTVSSYGKDKNFDNDVEELNLDYIKKANYKFQICAADEFREYFSLTNTIKSQGTDIFLPGVHRDIGGGYPEQEYSILLKMSKNKTCNDSQTVPSIESLTHLGWIREIPKKNYWDLCGFIHFRNKARKGYYHITLALMAAQANEHVKEDIKDQLFSLSDIEREKPIPKMPDMNKDDKNYNKEQAVYKALKEVNEKALSSTSLSACTTLFSIETYRILREYWLNFTSNQGPIDRFTASPRSEEGIYKRMVFDG